MAGSLDSLEAKLNEMLVTKSPVQLPESWRKWIATYSWVFALIGCVFGGLAVLALLPILGLASFFGGVVGAAGYVLFAWLAFLVLVGYVILLAVATPKLKRMEKSGWNLIFYSSLFFLAYDILNSLRYLAFGTIFSIIWDVLMSLIGLYFIFQIRSYFMGGKKK